MRTRFRLGVCEQGAELGVQLGLSTSVCVCMPVFRVSTFAFGRFNMDALFKPEVFHKKAKTGSLVLIPSMCMFPSLSVCLCVSHQEEERTI